MADETIVNEPDNWRDVVLEYLHRKHAGEITSITSFARMKNYTPGRVSQVLHDFGFDAKGRIITSDVNESVAEEVYGEIPELWRWKNNDIKRAYMRKLRSKEKAKELAEKQEVEETDDIQEQPETKEKFEDGKKIVDDITDEIVKSESEYIDEAATDSQVEGEDTPKADGEAESDEAGVIGSHRLLLIGLLGGLVILSFVAYKLFQSRVKKKKEMKEDELIRKEKQLLEAKPQSPVKTVKHEEKPKPKEDFFTPDDYY